MSSVKSDVGVPGKHNKPVEPQWRSDAAIASLNSTGVGAPRDAAEEGEVRGATPAKLSGSKKDANAPSTECTQKSSRGKGSAAAAKPSSKSEGKGAANPESDRGGSAKTDATDPATKESESAGESTNRAEGDDGDDAASKEVHANSNPTKALESEMELETAYAKNPNDLNIAFDLLSILIVRYRLNRSDEILNEIEATCMKDQFFKLRFHQSKAFVRYKQARYFECIAEFVCQENLMVLGIAGSPPGRDSDGFCYSVALNENIGHCLSSMNRLEEAEKRFTAALRLMQSSEPTNRENDIGGILVGLGLVKDRLGDAEGAVSVLQAAVAHYRKVACGLACIAANCHYLQISSTGLSVST
eukprot:m.234365 g.234365  ORF g.234365 m.234365 type:complete len:358 (-) comp19320_c0_seq1:1991-3064(-)